MSEFRITFPLSLGAFDLFDPSFYFKHVIPYIEVTNPPTISSKIKTDEYILLTEEDGSNYNVKMGDNGNTFDIKLKKNNDVFYEDWLGIAKGSLIENPGDLILFSNILLKSVETETNPTKKECMNKIAIALTNPSDLIRVFTRKCLNTLKIKLSSGETYICEQIDFSIWTESSPTQERKVFRSISLEGSVPEGVQTEVRSAIEALYGGNLLAGGFPGMLIKAITISDYSFQFSEKHSFQFSEKP